MADAAMPQIKSEKNDSNGPHFPLLDPKQQAITITTALNAGWFVGLNNSATSAVMV